MMFRKIVGQIENDLECGFVKYWLKCVLIFGPKSFCAKYAFTIVIK